MIRSDDNASETIIQCCAGRRDNKTLELSPSRFTTCQHLDLIKLIIIRNVSRHYESFRLLPLLVGCLNAVSRGKEIEEGKQNDSHCTEICWKEYLFSHNDRSSYNSTFILYISIQMFLEKRILLKRSKFPIASQTTTTQQFQLHPLRHQLRTRILMDTLLAVKSEARAVKMIYAGWKETVSEK